MHLDSFFRKAEFGARLFVQQTGGDQRKNLAFTRAEALKSAAQFFYCPESEIRLQNRPTESRIWSALLVQIKGLG